MNYTENNDHQGENMNEEEEIMMNDLQDRNSSGDDAASNHDASHKGDNMENGSMSQNNDTGREEVAGINSNLSQGDKKSTTSYQKHLRQSYGINKISKAKNLQTVRDQNRSLHAELSTHVESMMKSVDSIENDLDRLTMNDEINAVSDQIKKLDEILVKVDDQVKVLLNA